MIFEVDNAAANTMSYLKNINMLLQYKAWADALTFQAVSNLPEGGAEKNRPTRFGNMVHTLNHIYVIDSIFKAHLLTKSHSYQDRNTENHPPLAKLSRQQKNINEWYIETTKSFSKADLGEIVKFKYVDGQPGAMTRGDIINHVVNHGTYHRGFISDMMYQVPATMPSNDLTVFLRDVYYD